MKILIQLSKNATFLETGFIRFVCTELRVIGVWFGLGLTQSLFTSRQTQLRLQVDGGINS